MEGYSGEVYGQEQYDGGGGVFVEAGQRYSSWKQFTCGHCIGDTAACYRYTVCRKHLINQNFTK